MAKTRLDIAFTNLLISCFIKNLSHKYIKIVKILLKYFKSLKNKRISYDKEEKLIIKNNFNLDQTNNKKNQRFKYSFIFIQNSELISQYLKKNRLLLLYNLLK